MMLPSDDVVITGLGVTLPGCDTSERLWELLRRGESQLALEPDPSDDSARIALGRIRDFSPARALSRVPERFYARYDREVQIYLASVFAALAEARLELPGRSPGRVGIFDGCSRPMFGAWSNKKKEEHAASPREAYSRADLLLTPGLGAGIAASLLKTSGSVYTFNSTCCSGSVAIGQAFRELRSGLIDVAVASGHEASLLAPIFAMYREAGLLSLEREDPRRAIRPFGDSTGNCFGEGAVTLILERRTHAEARGATTYAEIKSYRYGNNGSHPTTPDVRGERAAHLIRESLEDAQISAQDIGFVVGHGNGVRLSDESEKNVIERAFGVPERDHRIPLLSNKPIFGHTMGASSALNVAAAALMLRHQYVVPTVNSEGSNGYHLTRAGEARVCKAGIAMSSGLGGNNTILLLQRVA